MIVRAWLKCMLTSLIIGCTANPTEETSSDVWLLLFVCVAVFIWAGIQRKEK
jgi:hypothetical protein